MKIYIGADHGGYKLKEELKKYLAEFGHEIEDMGAHTLNPQDDYPDFVFPVAEKVAQDPQSIGIVLGRSGVGEAIAANKVKGIRAALVWNEQVAVKAREHSDANILSLGADFIDKETAKRIVKIFLETQFSQEERHRRRIGKISSHESS